VLQKDGKRVRIPADEIEEIKDSSVSAMPAGLLDGFSETDVRDLFAYLMQNSGASSSDNDAPPSPVVSQTVFENE
jgi:hypothetical protein